MSDFGPRSITTVLLLALTLPFLILLAQGPDPLRHARIDGTLRKAQAIESRFSRDFLARWPSPDQDVVFLDETVADLHRQFDLLRKAVLENPRYVELFANHLRSTGEGIRNLETLVERYKSLSLLLDGSTVAFANLASDFDPSAESDPARIAPVIRALGATTTSRLQPDGSHARLLSRTLDELSSGGAADKPPVRDLIRHGRLLLQLTPRMGELLGELADIGLQDKLADFHGDYLHHYQSAMQRSRAYHLALYVLSGLLLSYMFYLLWQLRRGNRLLLTEAESRRRMAKALRDSDQRFRNISEAANDAVVVMDADSRITYWNPAAEEIFGHTASAALGRDLHSLVLPDEQGPDILGGLRHFRETGTGPLVGGVREVTARRKDGSEFAAEMSIAALRQDDRWQAVGIIRDVSERTWADKALLSVMQGTSDTVGEDFFHHLVKHLAQALGLRHAFVGEVDHALKQIRVTALWSDDGKGEPFEYDLINTPCHNVVGRRICVYPQGIRERFPHDRMLAEMGAESYAGAPLFDTRGRPLGLIGVMDGVPFESPGMVETVLRIFAARAAAEILRLRAEHDIFEAKELAEVTLRSIGEGVISCDTEGRVRFINPVAERLTGWDHGQAGNQRLDQVLHLVYENDRAPADDLIQSCLECTAAFRLLHPALLINRDGREFAIEQSAAPIHDGKGRKLGVVIVFHDVTKTRELTERMEHQARHDALTGLFNRGEFEQRLNLALEECRDEGATHALAYIDLDQFKLINDSCGHFAGDELLKQVAAVLLQTVRRHDVPGRLGGDEFGLLLLNCPLERARSLAEEVLNRLRQLRFEWEDNTFDIAGSVGLVPITAASESPARLMALADMACYAAKDSGRNRIHVQQPEDLELVRRQREVRWAADIKRALEENRFKLYAQPIMPLGRDTCPHLEILLRMTGPEGQLVPPGTFIPAAERFNLIGAVDRWVIRRVFQQAAASATSECLFCVNLSGTTLSQADISGYILGEMEASGATPGRLCFEITETAAISNLQTTSRFIMELKEAGFRFSLDDFGSGLSSFAYLKHLAVDYLKIDGAFIRDLPTDPMDWVMVEAIHAVGHKLGMRTVAEWVESEEIMEIVRDIGVDYAQGFAVGRPMPLEEARSRMRARAGG